MPASADLLLPAGKDRYYLQDNAKTHAHPKVKEVLFNAGFHCLDFPPYSPDLNPIENLWAIAAREVEKQQCETEKQLMDTIEAVWEKLDKDTLRKLVHSMPERCQAVIDAKGWHTKY